MLVDFILRSAEIGYPRDRKMIVQNICDYKGLQVTVSHGWWERFCQRNKGFSLRVPSFLSTARHQSTNTRVMEAYFDMIEETLEENNLTDKPCRISLWTKLACFYLPNLLNCCARQDQEHSMQLLEVINRRLLSCGALVQGVINCHLW